MQRTRRVAQIVDLSQTSPIFWAAIAAEELQYATQYTQSRNVSIEDYLSEVDRRIKTSERRKIL